MPLRMLLDAGVVAPEDVALVGARNLDPPEQAYLDKTGIDDSLERALPECDAVYIALDLDVLDPTPLTVFVPSRTAHRRSNRRDLGDVVSRVPLAGIGVTGHLRDARNTEVVSRLLLRPAVTPELHRT